MAKQKIGRVLSRTYKKEYGKRKNPLPEKLIFLYNLPFFAITKCLSPNKLQAETRVEILPLSLKKLADLHEDTKTMLVNSNENQRKLKGDVRQLKNEKKVLNNELNIALDKIKKLEIHIKNLEFNNDQLMKNNKENLIHPKSDIKSNIQMIEEKGIKIHGLDVQAGAPGLGKKR